MHQPRYDLPSLRRIALLSDAGRARVALYDQAQRRVAIAKRAMRLAGVCLLLIPASIPVAGLIYAIAFNGTIAGQSSFLPYP